MDNLPRPEDGLTNPLDNVPAFTYEAAIQTALDDLRYLTESESHRNTSISNFDRSLDAREPMSSTQHGCDSICVSVHSQGNHFSPFVEDSRGFNTSGTSRNNSDPYDAALVTSDPTQYWNNSASNFLIMNETYLDLTKSNPEIWDLSSDCRQDVNHDKRIRLNDTSRMAFHNRAEAGTDGQHSESHYNLSQILRNDNELCRISDVVASNSFFYSDENFAASGSSSCHKHENTPNVVGEMFQTSNKGKIKSTKCEEIKALICRICKEEIAQHETEENVLGCVDSLYYNWEGTDLRIHRSTHVLKTTCNICGKEHAVGNWHKSEHRCLVPYCKKTFPCRTRLYQHISEHGKYFKKFCWVCRRRFSEHKTEKDKIYVCCFCGSIHNQCHNLEIHCRLHFPKCFCYLCEEKYPLDKNCEREVKCFVCNCIFKCRVQLDEHFEVHVKHFSELSRVRESEEKKPSFLCPSHGCLATSSEIDFKNRLYQTAGLNAFKCETCGRRFRNLPYLSSHSRFCKVLPYKCEICETRFHAIDLLHSHALVKHFG